MDLPLSSERVYSGDELLALDDLPRERLVVPEWGNAIVYVRTMTGSERDKYEAGIIQMVPRRVNGKNIQEPRFNGINIRAKLVSLCTVNAAGERLFPAEKLTELGAKSASALSRIFNVAQRLNHLSDEDVEELRKNSEGGTSADSGSA